MFVLLLCFLCFCIFHDLIKDIIRTLTHTQAHTLRRCAIQGVPKSDDQRDQPQGCPAHPRLPRFPRLLRVIKQKLDPILPMAGGVVVVVVVVAWKQHRQHRNIIENLCICICLVYIFCVMLCGVVGWGGDGPWLAWNDGIIISMLDKQLLCRLFKINLSSTRRQPLGSLREF